MTARSMNMAKSVLSNLLILNACDGRDAASAGEPAALFTLTSHLSVLLIPNISGRSVSSQMSIVKMESASSTIIIDVYLSFFTCNNKGSCRLHCCTVHLAAFNFDLKCLHGQL